MAATQKKNDEVLTPPMARAEGLLSSEDGHLRCPWCAGDADYQRYHDEEWGFPVIDERRLFEKICLEGFQSGLSWLTILRKREAFREAFANFEAEKMVRFGPADVARLLADARIVRHRGKIEAALNNAHQALALREKHGSLAAYLWRYEPAPGSRPQHVALPWLKTQTSSPESVAMAKDLKRLGWRFIGPTTAYALMQAMGLVNDHVSGCHVREAALSARRVLQLPGG